MKWTSSHYAPFFAGASLLSAEKWDDIRLNGEPGFSIPDTREAWIEAVSSPELRDSASDLARILDGLGAHRVCSIGVGRAAIEWNLACQSSLEIVCADFTPKSIDRLRRVFTECREFHTTDMKRDAWPEADAYLLWRVDTELTNSEWRRVLSKIDRPAVFVVSGFLTPHVWLREQRARLKALARGHWPTFAGQWRTRQQWISVLGKQAREVKIGSLDAFILNPPR